MLESPASPSTAAFFDSLVLISNSIPKSGSTLLFSMQQNFLNAVCGKTIAQHQDLIDAGILAEGGFVRKPHSPEFLNMISNKNLTGGPYVFKTHTMVNGDLRNTIITSDNVFASLAIRDPLDVFFSARDNFMKTGEFPEFASVERGCETINGYFARIYEASNKTSNKKTVPVVRYDQIVSDPIGAVIQSLHSTIKDNVMRNIAKGYLNMQTAQSGAQKRLNLGTLDRRSIDAQNPAFNEVSDALSATRRALGFIPA